MSPILVLMIGIWLADTLRESKAKEEKLKKKKGLDQAKEDSIKIGDSPDLDKESGVDKFWDEDDEDEFWTDDEEELYGLDLEDELDKKIKKPSLDRSSNEERLRELFHDMEKGLTSLIKEKNISENQEGPKDRGKVIQSDIELQDSINRKKRELEEREARIRQKERDLEDRLRKKLEEEKASLSLASNREDIINGIILSEILNKPKSLR